MKKSSNRVNGFGLAAVVALCFFHPASAGAVTAAPVKLAWTASPDADVTGYAVYYGPVNSATNRMDAGVNLGATIPDLISSVNYSFRVVAYTSDQSESVPSNLIQYLPVVVTQVQLAAQADGSQWVQFRGPAGASCHVEYTDSLDGVPQWQVLGTMVAAADGSIAINDPASATSIMRFYRAVFP